MLGKLTELAINSFFEPYRIIKHTHLILKRRLYRLKRYLTVKITKILKHELSKWFGDLLVLISGYGLLLNIMLYPLIGLRIEYITSFGLAYYFIFIDRRQE